jgi:hypothetical protein
MKFSPNDQGLSEFDFHRAKDDCSAPYKLAIWTRAMPLGPSAIVGATEASRENEGRNTFMNCMTRHGYACTENCAEGLGSNSALDQKRLNSSSVSATQTPITGQKIAIGHSVLPGIESMVLYKEPARDAERLERLSISAALTVKAISGEWVNVVTERGSSGWVIGPLVTKP